MEKIEHIVFRPEASCNVMLHSHSALEGGCGLAALRHLILGQLIFINGIDTILENRSIFYSISILHILKNKSF